MDTKIKVVHIVSGDLWAGAEVQLYLTAKEIIRNKEIDFNAIILNKGELCNKLTGLGIKTHLVDEKENKFVKLLFKIYKIIKINQPNIIHTHRYKENFIASLIGLRYPYIFKIRTQHTTFKTILQSDGYKIRFYRVIDIITNKLFYDKIIAVSNEIREQISVFKHKIETIHNFIILSEITKQNKEYNVLKFKRDMDENFHIGFAGRLVEIKGLNYLIEASKILCDKYTDIFVHIIGSGPLYDELKHKIEEYNLTDRIILEGFIDNPISEIKKLDIFVLPSLYEGIPMVLLEAMALSRAVVCSNIGGIPEVVEEGENGFLFNSGDIDMLVSKLDFLYHNDNIKREIGKNAQLTIYKKFNSEINVTRLVNIYKELGQKKKL